MIDILRRIPHDFPLTEEPYREIAERINISEEEVLGTLERLQEEGAVRRVAAALHHRNAGYACNVMVVWRVGDEDIERAGRTMAGYPEVSHCYERDGGGFWHYNLYTMIHGKTMEACADTATRISRETGIEDYVFFQSKREFKKTSLSVENE